MIWLSAGMIYQYSSQQNNSIRSKAIFLTWESEHLTVCKSTNSLICSDLVKTESENFLVVLGTEWKWWIKEEPLIPFAFGNGGNWLACATLPWCFLIKRKFTSSSHFDIVVKYEGIKSTIIQLSFYSLTLNWLIESRF